MQHFSLAQHFQHYFEALPVRGAALRDEVFRLRYAVYCEELHFEEGSDFPDRRERDGHDEHAQFALLRHRDSGRAAGCVRLILHAAAPEQAFPFETVCAGRLDTSRYDPATMDRRRCGEISRLAVHGSFRRRKGEAATPEGISEGMSYLGGERHYPLVAMGLFMAASALALNSGLEQVLVLMEPRLARLLGSCGIPFTSIGEVVDYHGQRGPFRITRDELLHNLGPDALQFLRLLRQALS